MGLVHALSLTEARRGGTSGAVTEDDQTFEAGAAGPEQHWLPQRPGLAALLAGGGFPQAPGAWDWIEPPGPGGTGDVALCAVPDVVWAPGVGAAWRDGVPLFSPSAQAQAQVRTQARRARRVHRLERASLWQSAGALKNYGHFLFDGMTGLAALEAAGLLGRYPAISAPHSAWQASLLAEARLTSQAVAGPVAIGQAVYTTAMNAYLNRASGLVPALAARLGRGGGGAGAVYLSRRGYSGRIMVNEAALEAALAAQGAKVIRPERMPVAAQLAAVRGARVVVGASGAALANVLVLVPGARVVELRPAPVAEPWMGLTTAALGLEHAVLPLPVVTGAEVPLAARLRQLPRALTGRYRYAVRAEIAAVLAALG